MQDVRRTSDRWHPTDGYNVWPPFLLRVRLGNSISTDVRLTLRQMYHTACDFEFQMSCVRQCPLVVLLIQTRSLGAILSTQAPVI